MAPSDDFYYKFMPPSEAAACEQSLRFYKAPTATQILSNYRDLNLALEAEKLANLIHRVCTKAPKNVGNNTVPIITNPKIEEMHFEIRSSDEIYFHYQTYSPNESTWEPLPCDVNNIYWCLKADSIITHTKPGYTNGLSDYKKHMAKLAPVLRRLPEITADFI